jgi:hypothetical protein
MEVQTNDARRPPAQETLTAFSTRVRGKEMARRFMANGITLWHVKVQSTQVFDITNNQPAPAVTAIHTEVNPLTLEFDVDHQLQIDPTSVQATYVYTSDLKYSMAGMTMYTESSRPPGKTFTFLQATAGRNLKPCSGADPYLNVPARPGDPDPAGFATIDNTFRIAASIDVPTTLITTSITGPLVKNADTALGLQVDVQYDPTQTTNNSTLPPTGVPWAAIHTAFNVPSGQGVSTVTNAAACTITAKALGLTYIPSPTDVRANTDSSWASYAKISENLMSGGGNYVVHANNQVRPTVAGQDVSAQFKIYRYVRSWMAALGADGKRAGDYGVTATIGTAPDWLFDNGDGNGNVTAGGWYDIPGGPLLPADPTKWPRVRQIDEFVSSVYQFPEFGFLYYFVIWDIFPNAYRVRTYPARTITLNQWCAMRKSPSAQPTVDDTTYQGADPVDSQWRDAKGQTTKGPS